MPYALCTAFPNRANTTNASRISPRGSPSLATRIELARSNSGRLNGTKAAALKSFWDGQQGGVVPFVFYNLIEGTYDPTGNSTPGRYTVAFRNNWQQTTGLARTDVQNFELTEVA